MATKFLRKIIMEELRKVLKEEALTARRVNPEAGTSKDIEAHFSQQVEPENKYVQTSGNGIKCLPNAKYIQQAIKNKLSANVKSSKIVARLSDNRIGPTTTTAINILTNSKFPVSMEGFREICNANVDDLVLKIRNSTADIVQMNQVLMSSPRFDNIEIETGSSKPYICKDGSRAMNNDYRECPEYKETKGPTGKIGPGLEESLIKKEINKLLKNL